MTGSACKPLWLLQAISLARPNREMGVFTWAAGDMIRAMGTGPPTVHIHLELLSPEEWFVRKETLPRRQ